MPARSCTTASRSPIARARPRSSTCPIPSSRGPRSRCAGRSTSPSDSSSGRADLRDEVVQRLDIGPLLDATIGSLSKGQRKRALLAIGLLMPQPLLLADEPFDGLDLRQSREVAQTLRSYASSGRTMFLSIHQIKDAARVCDRFILLSGGHDSRRGHVRPARVAGRGARRRRPATSKRCSLPSRKEGTAVSSFRGCSPRNTASWSHRARGGCCCWPWDRSSA